MLSLRFPTPPRRSGPATSPANARTSSSKTPGVKSYLTVVGFSLLSGIRNTYSAFLWVTLDPWGERKKPEEQYDAIISHLNTRTGQAARGQRQRHPRRRPSRGSARRAGSPSSWRTARGKDVPVSERELEEIHGGGAPAAGTGLQIISSPLSCRCVPQAYVDVDRDKAMKQGVDIGEIYQTLQAYLGGTFVNYFNRFGRQWQVYVEAEGPYRSRPEDLEPVLRAQPRRPARPALRPGQLQDAIRPGIHPALQPLSQRPNQRQRRPGLQLRPGQSGPGGGLRPNHGAGDGLRLHGHVLPGKAGPERRQARRCFRAFACCLFF